MTAEEENDSEFEALYEEYQQLLRQEKRPANLIIPAVEDPQFQVDANRLVSLIQQ